MTQICDYSSLIFAGNTTVLLIIAITTDYWEYRGYTVNKIIPHLILSRDLTVSIPSDTKSYVQIITRKLVISNTTSNFTKNDSGIYHAPVFVNTKITNITTVKRVENNNMQMSMEVAVKETQYVLFQQYGNLFRDCDNLEAIVRLRIGLFQKRPRRCVYFGAARQTSFAYKHIPEIEYIETAASATALLCIAAMCIGSCCGAYALFVKYPCFPAFHLASCCSLFAGFSLTLGIALFHGKCYILRKTEIMPDRDLPFRALLNEARQYYYGWSFCLAWICVFFCYISSYVWLTKSQGHRIYYKVYKRAEMSSYRLYDSAAEYDVTDIATI